MVLPELDDVRFVLAGLRCGRDQTVLHVLTRRLRETRRNGPFGMIFAFRFSLWARDSTGQWHVTYVRGSDD